MTSEKVDKMPTDVGDVEVGDLVTLDFAPQGVSNDNNGKTTQRIYAMWVTENHLGTKTYALAFDEKGTERVECCWSAMGEIEGNIKKIEKGKIDNWRGLI